MLEVWRVTKERQNNGQKMRILQEVSLKVEDGQFVSIVGPSGCGKTTLLRIIAGLEEPTGGRVFLDNQEIAESRKKIGFIFQDYALFPWRNVQKNVELGLEIKGLNKKERTELASKYINMVGLSDHSNKYPNELSGGMQSRVAIARTMAANPSIFLMDEPFAALDAQVKGEMHKELLRIWSIEKKTVFFVTHDVKEAVFLSDIVCVLSSPPGTIKELVVNTACRNEFGSRENDQTLKDLETYVLSLIDKSW